MSAPTFFAHFKSINGYLRENPAASVELQSAFTAVATAFRSAYTPDEFRRAVAANESVSSDLEDRITSALMAFNQARAKGR